MHDPDVPLTLEGWAVLHQMFRVRWSAWRAAAAERRAGAAEEAAAALEAMERDAAGPSAVFAGVGHKADLLLVHFRQDVEGLAGTQQRLAQLGLHDFLEPTSSYLSLVELGMYEMTAKIHERLRAAGHEIGGDAWRAAMKQELAEQAKRMSARLWTQVPPGRFLCFYPMNKRRGEGKNWYRLPIEERLRMMRDHGKVGRMYAGQVTQVISGSIGFDDWEWGVDLFADDPVVFKKLVAEMRFDEASYDYGEFGPFFVGVRFPASELPSWLRGEAPAWTPKAS